MSAEARFALGYREAPRDDPGLVLGLDGLVRLVAPGGARTALGEAASAVAVLEGPDASGVVKDYALPDGLGAFGVVLVGGAGPSDSITGLAAPASAPSGLVLVNANPDRTLNLVDQDAVQPGDESAVGNRISTYSYGGGDLVDLIQGGTMAFLLYTGGLWYAQRFRS